MIRIILWGVLITVIFRIVFYYILPVFRITSAASSHMRKMQEQMKDMEQKMNEQPTRTHQVNKEGDYIDYEEVK